MFTSKNIISLIVRNSIISIIFIVTSITAIYFIKNEIQKITDAISLNNKLEAELKKKTESFSFIQKDALIIGENDNLIEKAFIPSNNISEFTNTLDSIALKYNLQQRYRFDTPIPSTTSEYISSSTISYYNNLNIDTKTFSNYLKEFENLPYFTRIESLSISSQDQTGIMGLSTVSLKAILLTKTTK